MKQIHLLFITLFVLIARLNAQTLVGDWDVEVDNSKSRFLFGDNFAVWQMEPNMQAVMKLLRQTKK